MNDVCHITFLPSEHGRGYRASIRGRVGDDANWHDCGYDRLSGVALEPTDKDASNAAWLSYARERLSQQGVVFVRAQESIMSADDKIRDIARMLWFLDEDRKDRKRATLATMSPTLQARVQLEQVRLSHSGKRQMDEYFRESIKSYYAARKGGVRRLLRL
jgi:hypothetical protein